jgi:hypothetical protein
VVAATRHVRDPVGVEAEAPLERLFALVTDGFLEAEAEPAAERDAEVAAFTDSVSEACHDAVSPAVVSFLFP